MASNSFGDIFRVSTWGESHGPALGATVDGCPPGVTITEEMIQHWMDKQVYLNLGQFLLGAAALGVDASGGAWRCGADEACVYESIFAQSECACVS